MIRDPPFSRMDLVSCRNLLIYFGAQVQQQVIPIFHYALRPNGYLFLGTSENVTQHSDLFAPGGEDAAHFPRAGGAGGTLAAARQLIVYPPFAGDCRRPGFDRPTETEYGRTPRPDRRVSDHTCKQSAQEFRGHRAGTVLP